MAGTPQVFPLLWGNNQGQTASKTNTAPVWNPNAPAPQPLVSQKEQSEIAVETAQANPGKTPLEVEAAAIKQHNDVAVNALAQKNRKRKQSSIELPFDPTIEEGTTYMLQGFAQNFDGKWLVTQVDYTFTAKGGSRMLLELQQCLDPPNKTPGGASSSAGGASKAITVPHQPGAKSELLHDGGINSISPQPKNATGLTTDPNELAPTWLNANGALNAEQQDLNADNAGPQG
jgi:hypothetical protein